MSAMVGGRAGHEHDFYDFVRNSGWLPRSGGTGYTWFNDLVFLAYSLDDERLKSQIHSVADTVLGMQTEDGRIGPEVPDIPLQQVGDWYLSNTAA
jgi:hypothetical protein